MYKLLFGGLLGSSDTASRAAPPPLVPMEVERWQQAHGHRGDAEWPLPRLMAACDEANRADQGNTTRADEFLDEPEVLDAKIELIAQLIKQSKYCIAYTGAGLSKSSGIPDYASKAKHSIVATPKIASSLDAQPTYAHHVLAALERRGYLKYYVQQNHDGYGGGGGGGGGGALLVETARQPAGTDCEINLYRSRVRIAACRRRLAFHKKS